MIFKSLPLSGAFRIELDRREDERGFFARLYCREEFARHGLATDWPQLNTSFTRMPGTIRGVRFQRAPVAESKIVRCLRGAVFDVMVDLRQGSPTYGQWTSLDLDSDNRCMAYIPKGLAHGFQTLAPDTELLYFHDTPYSPGHDAGVHYADAKLNIAWPLPIVGVSPRDEELPHLSKVEPVTT